jgi:hypothetical protein
MSEIKNTNYTSLTDDFGNKCPVKINNKSGEIKIKKPPFFAFNKSNFHSIENLIFEHQLAATMFMFFVNEMDNTNAICISYKAMEEIFLRSRKTLSNAISFLKENNYIVIMKSGNMNIYCINAQIVWSQSQDKIDYAKFNATVYITKTEQNRKRNIKNKTTRQVRTKE